LLASASFAHWIMVRFFFPRFNFVVLSRSRLPSIEPLDAQPLAPHLPEDVVVEHIMMRVPAAAAVRFWAIYHVW
jgi:hypothetical protein